MIYFGYRASQFIFQHRNNSGVFLPLCIESSTRLYIKILKIRKHFQPYNWQLQLSDRNELKFSPFPQTPFILCSFLSQVTQPSTWSQTTRRLWGHFCHPQFSYPSHPTDDPFLFILLLKYLNDSSNSWKLMIFQHCISYWGDKDKTTCGFFLQSGSNFRAGKEVRPNPLSAAATTLLAAKFSL